MALIKSLTFAQSGQTFTYWRLAHAVINRPAARIDAHVWGYADKTARLADKPGHVLRYEIPLNETADPNEVRMSELYGAVRTRAPLDCAPWQTYTTSPLSDAKDD